MVLDEEGQDMIKETLLYIHILDQLTGWNLLPYRINHPEGKIEQMTLPQHKIYERYN